MRMAVTVMPGLLMLVLNALGDQSFQRGRKILLKSRFELDSR